MDFEPKDLEELGLQPDYLDNLETTATKKPNKEEQIQIESARKQLEVKSEEPPMFDQTSLYLQGLERLRDYGFLLKPNPESKLFGHSVYMSKEPPSIKGINFPQGLRVWSKVTDQEELSTLYKYVEGWGNTPTAKLFTKSFQPKIKQSELTPLQALAIAASDLETEKYNTGKHTFHLGLNPGCEGMPYARNNPNDYLDKACSPISLLPPRDWFDESIRDLKLEDIITILPPNELAMFSLAFGRGLVGRSYHIPPGSDEPVKHFARMGLLVQGNAGIGKSATLDRGLLRVLKRLGYVVSTSYDLEGKYNDSSVFQSNIAYLDDTNITQLTKLVSSQITKMVITNSTIKYEQKYIPSGVIPCHTFLCICLNEIDEYVTFKMDEGNADRLKLVQCYTAPQMQSEPLVVLGKTYPTRSPDIYLPMLANNLGVDVDSLWLWACRLMADDFYYHINNDLYKEVEKRSLAIDFSWMKSVIPGMMSLFYVMYLVSLMERTDKPLGNDYDRPLSSLRADSMLFNLDKMNDPEIIMIVAEDYYETPHSDHPWLWLERIHPDSIGAALTQVNQMSQPMTTSKPWEKALELIELKSGFSFKPGHHRIVQGWKSALANHHLLEPLATKIINWSQARSKRIALVTKQTPGLLTKSVLE